MSAPTANEELLALIEELEPDELARHARHEEDEDYCGAPGALAQAFLHDARNTYVAWVRAHGGFPTEETAPDAATSWHREVAGIAAAQAYVDLDLPYSGHARAALDASMAGLLTVLDSAAEQLAVTLTKQYGPTDRPDPGSAV